MLTISHDVMVQDAMRDFSSAFKSFVDETEVSDSDLSVYKSKVNSFYQNEFAKKYKEENSKWTLLCHL